MYIRSERACYGHTNQAALYFNIWVEKQKRQAFQSPLKEKKSKGEEFNRLHFGTAAQFRQLTEPGVDREREGKAKGGRVVEERPPEEDINLGKGKNSTQKKQEP